MPLFIIMLTEWLVHFLHQNPFYLRLDLGMGLCRRRGPDNLREQGVLAVNFCIVALGALELVLANALPTQQKSGIHIQVSDTLAFARTPGVARMVPVLVAEGQVHLCVARHLGPVES